MKKAQDCQPKNISNALATIALLANTQAQATQVNGIQSDPGTLPANNVEPVFEDQTSDQDNKIDAAMLYYQEQDRVTAAEGIFNIQKLVGDKTQYHGKLVLNTLTGSSANGAEQWSADWSSNHGVYLSREYCYTSLGINSGAERSFNKNNTQFSLAMAYYYDTVDPVGGRPVGLSQMVFRGDYETQAAFQDAFDLTRNQGSQSKQTVDLSLSLTQTVSRDSLVQLTYNFSSLNGYMTDPYKLLSVVDPSGRSQAYIYENRPDERYKQSVFVYNKNALSYGVFDISYRYSQDDWGVSSDTFESRYRYNFSHTMYGQLQARVYRQQAAGFYQPFIVVSEEVDNYASAIE
nr:DUF3570 domain-containing protein [Shewanella atlantica]